MKKNKPFNQIICSLYEAEAFLAKYNNISDILSIAKILQKHFYNKKKK